MSADDRATAADSASVCLQELAARGNLLSAPFSDGLGGVRNDSVMTTVVTDVVREGVNALVSEIDYLRRIGKAYQETAVARAEEIAGLRREAAEYRTSCCSAAVRCGRCARDLSVTVST